MTKSQARTEETEDRIVAKTWWQKHGATKIAPKLRKIREGRSEKCLGFGALPLS
jgi:hypothetical protein